MEKQAQIVVLEIDQNIVKGISLHLDAKSAETAMINKCKQFVLTIDEATASDILDNGYFEFEDKAICITWPEPCQKPLFAVISCSNGVCDECMLFPDEYSARSCFIDLLHSGASNADEYSTDDISSILEQGYERINTNSINIIKL